MTMQRFFTECGESFHELEAPTLANFPTMPALIDAYQPGPGRHYFDPASLRFFGVSRPRIVAGTHGAATCEIHRNAPEGLRYSVRVWTLDEAGLPQPSASCAHADRRSAERCARATVRTLSAAHDATSH